MFTNRVAKATDGYMVRTAWGPSWHNTTS